MHLSDGIVLEADMIIGADGPHSTVRLCVQEEDAEPKTTGTIAFTGNVPMQKILEDDVLKTEGFSYTWPYWLGPHRCFMGELSFPIGFHLSLTHVLGYPIVSNHSERKQLS